VLVFKAEERPDAAADDLSTPKHRAQPHLQTHTTTRFCWRSWWRR
jgi:hypothetical protein